jgi:glutathione S-transferase
MLGVTPPKAAVKEDLGILKRALRVMEGWLSEHKWIAGDEASIADIRCVS